MYLILGIIVVILLIYHYWLTNVKKYYLDSNATTRPYYRIRNKNWLNCSSSYAVDEKKVINNFKSKVLKSWGGNYCTITSGSTEAITQFIQGWRSKNPGKLIMASAVEHHAVLANLSKGDLLITGPKVTLSDIVNNYVKEVGLIIVMASNNETGIINDWKNINDWCLNNNVDYFCDCTQLAGKYKGKLPTNYCISLHKMHGPKGIGALVTKEKPVPLIPGKQQDGMRGGTENIPTIEAATKTITKVLKNRNEKNEKLKKLKMRLLKGLKNYPMFSLIGKNRYGWNVFYLDDGNKTLDNVVLLSFIFVDDEKRFCNVEYKKLLSNMNCFISIGSACNTSTKGPSHVVKEFNLPFIVRCGVLRISFDDMTKNSDIDFFLKNLPGKKSLVDL